jgi:hypothetical protein
MGSGSVDLSPFRSPEIQCSGHDRSVGPGPHRDRSRAFGGHVRVIAVLRLRAWVPAHAHGPHRSEEPGRIATASGPAPGVFAPRARRQRLQPDASGGAGPRDPTGRRCSRPGTAGQARLDPREREDLRSGLHGPRRFVRHRSRSAPDRLPPEEWPPASMPSPTSTVMVLPTSSRRPAMDLAGSRSDLVKAAAHSPPRFRCPRQPR